MKLRTGELSLTQICSRVEYEKSGLWFASLDDIRHKLPQSILDKINNSDPSTMQAFREMELEQKLLKTAELRGVSIEELKKSAKNLNLATKCSRSVYRKPFDALKQKRN